MRAGSKSISCCLWRWGRRKVLWELFEFLAFASLGNLQLRATESLGRFASRGEDYFVSFVEVGWLEIFVGAV